ASRAGRSFIYISAFLSRSAGHRGFRWKILYLSCRSGIATRVADDNRSRYYSRLFLLLPIRHRANVYARAERRICGRRCAGKCQVRPLRLCSRYSVSWCSPHFGFELDVISSAEYAALIQDGSTESGRRFSPAGPSDCGSRRGLQSGGPPGLKLRTKLMTFLKSYCTLVGRQVGHGG